MFEIISGLAGEVLSVILAATVVLFLSQGYRVAQKTNSAYLEEQAVMKSLQETREFNIYDNNTLRGQDVISALLQYKGYPNIILYNSNGTVNKIFDENTPQSQFAVSSLYSLTILSPENTFSSQIDNDANGTVDTIKFRLQ